MKSPIRWVGGKSWLVPVIYQKFWNKKKYSRYVDVFCGGCGIPFGMKIENCLLSDRNAMLINFYQWMQAGVKIDILEGDYQKIRNEFNLALKHGENDGIYAAELFYSMNKRSFNGLYRLNAKGQSNVPEGSARTIKNTITIEHSKLMENWEIRTGDFEDVHPDKSDLLYCDPPYDDGFTGYNQKTFSWGDQVRLAKWAYSQPCDVVISNSSTSKIIDLYTEIGFNIEFVEVYRGVSGKNSGRGNVKEVLASKII